MRSSPASPSSAPVAGGPLARLAAAVARRRRLVIAVWVLALVAAAPLAAQQVDRLSGGGWEVPGTDSDAVRNGLQQFPGRAGELVAVFAHGDDPAAVQAAVKQAAATADRRADIIPAGPIQQYDGGRAALAPLSYTGTPGDVYDTATAVREAITADGATTVRLLGDAAAWSEMQEVSKEDLTKSEGIGLPVALAILLVAFGTLLAAGIPLLIGMFAVTITGGFVYLLAGVFELSVFTTNIASMVGIGVAVDYSLFVVARYRRRLQDGFVREDALKDALGSAGTAVVYSGATVALSMAGLFLVDVAAVRSMAVGAIIVVGVAVLAAVTLLPALLAVSGTKIERFRIRLPRRRERPAGAADLWSRWTHAVMRRPAVSAIAGAAVLLALAAPVLSIKTSNGALDQLPKDGETRPAIAELSRVAGPGVLGPIQVIAPNRDAADRVVAATRGLDGVATVLPPVPATTGEARLVEIVPAGAPESKTAVGALERVEAATSSIGGVQIGGVTAFNRDMDAAVFGDLWWVGVFVLASSFVVLLVLLRSLLLPLKAVILNALSVGAAYGVLVGVFQWGWLDWIGFDSPGFVDTSVPLLLLAIVFGLSMDYEVFLLTRIRERWLAGDSTERAVAGGLASSARTITAAALIMVAVFGAFALAGTISIQQLGLGLAVAILVDATIVRLILVPAAMQLLGEWNWWLPGRPRTARLRPEPASA